MRQNLYEGKDGVREKVKSRGPIATGTTSEDFSEIRDRLEKGSRKDVDRRESNGQWQDH